jgi:hypothetical protein
LKIVAVAAVVASAFWAATAQAQTAAPSPAPAAAASAAPSPTPSPSPTPRPWVPSGFAAASYNAASNTGPNAFSFANGTPSRVFDTLNRQPMLNAINVQLTHNGTIGGKIELTAGSNADVIASYPTANGDSFDVTQAYLTYTSGLFTLQGGKYETLAGAEVIEDPANVNISRSILFGYAIPFTHTGLRLTYAPSSLWSFIAGVNNGWDNIKGSGGNKTLELGLAYNGPIVSVTVQGYGGDERISNSAWSTTGNSPLGTRAVIDSVVTYHATPKLTLQGNADKGRQDNAPLVDGTGTLLGPGTATWFGVAGYATYQFTPKFSAALRGETFDDAGGYRTGYDQHWHETTLTLSYAPSDPFIFRLEGRSDGSDQAVWALPSGALQRSLSSVAAQAIVKF